MLCSFQAILLLGDRTRLTDSHLLCLPVQADACLLGALDPSQSHEWKMRALSPSGEMSW